MDFMFIYSVSSLYLQTRKHEGHMDFTFGGVGVKNLCCGRPDIKNEKNVGSFP